MSRPANTIADILRRCIVEESGCWTWQGDVQNTYGRVRYRGDSWLVHRLIHTLVVGPIPDGLEIDHLCRNRLCQNPEHLESVTHAENMRRAGAAVTHCLRGHPRTPDNLCGKSCRPCKLDHQRRTRARARSSGAT